MIFRCSLPKCGLEVKGKGKGKGPKVSDLSVLLSLQSLCVLIIIK